MAYEGFQLCIPGLVAGADLSAASVQFKFVKLNADHQVILCSGTTDIPIGVLQAPTPTSATGQAVTVCAFGLTKVQVGESMVAGDLLATNGSGLGVDAEAGTDTTIYIVGQVIDVSGGTSSGNYVTAVVNCCSPGRAA